MVCMAASCPATGRTVYLTESVSTHVPLVRSGDTMLYADCEQQNGCVGVMDSPSHQQQILSGFAGFDFWRDSGNETLLMDPSSVFLNAQNSPGQGLSLGLGTGIQMPLTDSSDPILGLASFLVSNPVIDECTMIIPPGFSGLRYLKATQQLLDEVVNVRKASNHPPHESNDESKTRILKEDDEGDLKDDPAANIKESTDCSSEVSEEKRRELQDKLSRLVSMLDEVDKRYNQYLHQMQIVRQSFDAAAGSGASKPYTVLALRRISKQFHCLRDAIAGQIQATHKRLGEEDAAPATSISRLRYIDQTLRHHRAVHQLSMMQQNAWRPQRGLPESSVAALRAWLFEHFLHPYPKDSDKALLARQTGLTRGQVSNWFINARVRLWKPMVEEMYNDETGDVELELDSLSENTTMASKSEDKRPDLEQATCSEECPVHELYTVITEGTADFQERNCKDADNTEHDTSRVGSAVSLSLDLQHREGGHLQLPEARYLGMVAGGSDSFCDTQVSSAAAETMAFAGKSTNSGDQQWIAATSRQLMHDFVA